MRDPEKRRITNQRAHARMRERMANDPEYREAMREKERARHQRRKNDPAYIAKSYEIQKRYRERHRNDEFYRLRMVYNQIRKRCVKRGWPVASQSDWLAALPPRPTDETDLWTWALSPIAPEKGLVPGNFEWRRRAKCMALDDASKDLNIGVGGDDNNKRKRLYRIAHRDDLETVADVEKSPSALTLERAKRIDHEANIGRFFGYSLRVIAVDIRKSSSSSNAFYVCRCSACGAIFERTAMRLLGSRSSPANTDCPHCQRHAARSAMKSRNSGYYEIKRKLRSIITREELFHESISNYSMRARNMDFCEMCIDADLAGHGNELKEIYAL